MPNVLVAGLMVPVGVFSVRPAVEENGPPDAPVNVTGTEVNEGQKGEPT